MVVMFVMVGDEIGQCGSEYKMWYLCKLRWPFV